MLHTRTPFAQTLNIITYQGKLTHQGKDVSGERTITARLYANEDGTQIVWEGTYKTYITDGIFALPLGAGKYPLPAPIKLDKPLWVGITVDGIELRPLTQLTSSPYALNVADKSITKAKLADELVLGNAFKQYPQWIGYACSTNPNDDDGSSTATHVIGGGCGNVTKPLISMGNYDGYASIIGGYNNKTFAHYSVIGGGNENRIGTGSLSNPGYIYSAILGGTFDTIKSAYSLIGGGMKNYTSGDFSFVGGGYTNRSIDSFGVITGGYSNTVKGMYGTVGGGRSNQADTFSIIPGGRNLKVGSYSFGFNADNSSNITDLTAYSKITYFGNSDVYISNVDNKARQLRFYEPTTNSILGYGFQPGLLGHYTAFKAQSQDTNIIYTLPDTSGINGYVLTNNGNDSLYWGPGALNGGWLTLGNSGTTDGLNYLGTKDSQAVEIRIYNNGDSTQGYRRVMRYEPLPNSPNIIGGFNGNKITNSTGSYIGSGGALADSNKIDTSLYSIIVGGKNNTVKDNYNIIVGGKNNYIESNLISTSHPFERNRYSFLGGGLNNRIKKDPDHDEDTLVGIVLVGGHDNKAAEEGSFIGGGAFNETKEEFNFIGGGNLNLVEAEHGVVVAGYLNTVNSYGEYCAIVGGTGNSISSSDHFTSYSFIGGGYSNHIEGYSSTIAGGVYNTTYGLSSYIGGGGNSGLGNTATGAYSVIDGGLSNQTVADKSSIGGGEGNKTLDVVSGATHSTIPGGKELVAQSYGQTVMGVDNFAQGTSTSSNFRSSSNKDDRLFIIGNGTDAINRSNAFEVSNNGHSIVYDNNTTNTNPAIRGARYIDNTPIAWGKVNAAGALLSGFGISSVTFVAGPPSHYLIKLNYVDPYSGNQVQISNGNSIVATINDESGEDGNHQCIFINVGKLKFVNGFNEFRVFTSVQNVQATPLGLTCGFIPFGFNFVVFGRPAP